MDEIVHKNLKVNGINMHVAEIGKGPDCVLFLHGFPELWYSWRHQMLHLSAHGYRAIAPDLRGYGDTDVPPSAARPDRIKALVNTSIVFQPRNPAVQPIQGYRACSAMALHVQIPGTRKSRSSICIRKEQAVISTFLSVRDVKPPCIPVQIDLGALFKSPVALPSWLTEEDVNYYELGAECSLDRIKVPVKCLIGDLDLTYHFPGVKEYIDNGGFKKYVPLLEQVVVMEGVAHFPNQERPEEAHLQGHESFLEILDSEACGLVILLEISELNSGLRIDASFCSKKLSGLLPPSLPFIYGLSPIFWLLEFAYLELETLPENSPQWVYLNESEHSLKAC
ncbi:Bifunctional epoxide hydrolase 2 [Sesamum angolense]|uniref:Bifunctional epoxide hydrolase 2 n=1 Tax=Sesamum angolense TaxID=2727404 RepID=A0AAE2BI69_9LAMI|nr:Bifunctional epoxide hydrolase 2 [Sesamum angolense]